MLEPENVDHSVDPPVPFPRTFATHVEQRRREDNGRAAMSALQGRGTPSEGAPEHAHRPGQRRDGSQVEEDAGVGEKKRPAAPLLISARGSPT